MMNWGDFRRRAAGMGVTPFRVYLAEFLMGRRRPAALAPAPAAPAAADSNSNSDSPASELLPWFLLHIAVQAGARHLCSDLHSLADEMPEWYTDEAAPDLPRRIAAELDALLEDGLQSGIIGRLAGDEAPADTLKVPRPPLVLSADGRELYLLRRRREEDRFLAALGERIAYRGPRALLPPNITEAAGTAASTPSTPVDALFSMLAEGKTLILLSGGPGTGKTKTAAALIERISRARAAAGLPPARTALTAPTGRAAARMAERIPEARGRTLHGLLGITPGGNPARTRGNPVPADLVVLDECSMVDLPMMNRLLDAVPPHVPLLLTGDPNQLPSVEAGALLGDLLSGLRDAADSGHPGRLSRSVVHLTKVYRSEAAVLHIAAAVLQGGIDELRRSLQAAGSLLHPVDGPRSLDTIIALLAEKHRRAEAAGESFIALTPLRRGPWGVPAMNERISRIIGGTSAPFPGMPIVISRNAPSRNLWNGDRGFFRKKHESLRAVFGENADERELSPALLPPWEPGWIQTIHKSQGSEFDSVAVILPEGAHRLLSREILYTAVTRARKRIELYAGPETLAAALERRALRNSRIRRWAAEPPSDLQTRPGVL